MELTRRSFIKVAGAAGLMDPIRRRGSSHMKLSLAAYSFREYLAGPKKSMTLEDFVDLCADYNLDAVEPTSYYFPEPVTSEYLQRLRRRAFLLARLYHPGGAIFQLD